MNAENWATKLAGDSVDDQIAALRQIASREAVVGLTGAVVALTGSRRDEVRMWAAEALEKSVRPRADEVPQLIELLQQADDGEILYWAATMLGRLGNQAVAAVAALQDCLSTSMYLPARERATWALCQLGCSASPAVPALRKAAQGAPPRLRRLATEALRVIGEAAA